MFSIHSLLLGLIFKLTRSYSALCDILYKSLRNTLTYLLTYSVLSLSLSLSLPLSLSLSLSLRACVYVTARPLWPVSELSIRTLSVCMCDKRLTVTDRTRCRLHIGQVVIRDKLISISDNHAYLQRFYRPMDQQISDWLINWLNITRHPLIITPTIIAMIIFITIYNRIYYCHGENRPTATVDKFNVQPITCHDSTRLQVNQWD